jgi:RNA polymerase sigma-70 factor (ECF subfamily)
VRTDVELLNAWREGDQRAGELLFERHYASVLRFFRNKVNRGLDDVVQDTFLALVETKDRFRGDSSFRSYLFGVAHNTLRYHYRKNRKDADRLDFGRFTAQDLSPGPGTVAAQQSEQRLLLQALRGIPMEHQMVLELYYWEPMTAAEIAEVLGEPEGTVRTRIRRAKQLLEQKLQDLAETPELFSRTSSALEDWARSLRSRAGQIE